MVVAEVVEAGTVALEELGQMEVVLGLLALERELRVRQIEEEVVVEVQEMPQARAEVVREVLVSSF